MTAPIVPSTNQPISENGIVTTVWQRFFNALVSSPSAIASIQATQSPVAYKAAERGTLSISGGTISDVTLQRASVSISLGPVRLVPVANADTVTITYSVAPTISFIPS